MYTFLNELLLNFKKNGLDLRLMNGRYIWCIQLPEIIRVNNTDLRLSYPHEYDKEMLPKFSHDRYLIQ